MVMEKLTEMNGRMCACGKEHSFGTKVITGCGAVEKVAAEAKELGGAKAFVLSDRNTYAAAGEQVCGILKANGFAVVSCCFSCDAPVPDEHSVGYAAMCLEADCDIIVAVGSGVINDIGKLLSHISRRPYIIVATAPSMDGYASATSSMERSGLKASLPSRCADVIIGDTDILCKAPVKLLKAGLGDMIAKYISICEWRIAQVIAGEYYCPEIAQLVRDAVKQCVDQAPGLLRREPEAVSAVFEGLIIGGVAMNYAGVSRPASGVEHYISHVLDMRSVAFGTASELHGLQCAVGTLEAARRYEKLKSITPDREKALAWAGSFDFEAWSDELRCFIGPGAESMIAQEAKEKKYDTALHAKRLERILENWEQLLAIIEEEVPASESLEALLQTIQAPASLPELGVEEGLLPMIFRCTKDIRDKYVLSRLCWDLGILEQIAG